MLPAVRPATLLLAAVGGATLLTALSVWIRISALDEHGTAAFSTRPLPALAVAYRMFSTDDEANVPAWFSAGLLLLIALVALGISVQLRASGRAGGWYWAGMAALFGYLSLDEMAMVHEKLIDPLSTVVEAEGVLTFPWVVVAGPLVAVVALVYLPFLRRLPLRAALLLVLAGSLYVGGALGMELVGGAVFVAEEGLTLSYVLVTSAEELLEMLGAGVCLYAVAGVAGRLPRSAGRGHGGRPASAGGAPAPPTGQPPAPDVPVPVDAAGGRNTANGSVTSSLEEANR